MYEARIIGCLGVMAAATIVGCRTVPITERSQLMLSSEATENVRGVLAYAEYKAKYRVSSNAEYTAALRRCGEAIKKVAGRDDFDWEFTLFDSPIKNACCLPGGKVVFFSGLVDKMNNEAEMAFVMAHEVAHAIARHGGERISWGRVVSLGGVLVELGIQNDRVTSIYGTGSQLGVVLPFSRENEAEADYIGLMLMARAGYNPLAAAAFWKRFAAGSAASTILDDLASTHPCDEDRIIAMEMNLDAALDEYRKAPNRREYGAAFRVGGADAPSAESADSRAADGDVSITL